MASRQIQVEDHRFYRLSTLSYKYAPLVLRELIRQYHTGKGHTFESFLNSNKHELFHRRHKTSKCCRTGCKEPIDKVFLDHQWNDMFAQVKGRGGHAGHNNLNCSDIFLAKRGLTADICDVSLAFSLITNIRDLATNTFSLLYCTPAKLNDFLFTYQHRIFHSKETRKCCQCTADPSGKKTISISEWDSLYIEPAAAAAPCPSQICSCKYAPIPGVSLPTVQSAYPDLLFKLIQIVGPLATIKTIRNEVLAHSSYGTLNCPQFEDFWKTMTDSLGELIDMCSDTMFKDESRNDISALKTCVIDEKMLEELKDIVQPMISHMQQDLAETKHEVQETKRDLQASKQVLSATNQSLLKTQLEQVLTKQELMKTQQELQQTTTILEDPIPRSIREQFKQEIEQWKKEDQKFVNTRASADIAKAIHDRNYVVITGSSGNGKTFTNHHIALLLQKEEQFEIIPFLPNGPSDIINYRIKGRNQVYVIDDISGKSTLNVRSVEKWSSKLDLIKNLIKQNNHSEDEVQSDDDTNGKVKLLISCRLNIYRDPRFQSLRYLCTNEKNILSDSLCLTKQEKISMMEAYFSHSLYTEENSSFLILHKYDFFPLLCKLSNGKSTINIGTLLTNPMKSITDDLTDVRHQLPYGYCAMMLCVLFEKGFSTDWLVPSVTPPDIQNIVMHVCKECHIKYFTESARNQIKKHLEILEQTYLQKVGTRYSIIHDKIVDIVVTLIGNDSFECFLQHAPSTFIGDRYLFKSLTNSSVDGLIVVPEHFEDLYFSRLVNDLSQGNSYSSLHNAQLSHAPYRKKFVSFCTKRKAEIEIFLRNIVIKATTKKENSFFPLIDAALEGYPDIVSMLLQMKCDLNQTDSSDQTPLFVASKCGHIETVKLLIQHGADISLCNDYGQSPLFTAILRGHTEIVSILLQHGANVSQFDKYGYSLLYTASEKGITEIVRLLLQHGADVSKCDPNLQSPLYAASKLRYTTIVKLLLEHGANVSQSDNEGQSPLYVASGRGYNEIVTLLLQHVADVSRCERTRQSPLYTASEGGHAETVALLLQHKANVDCFDYCGRSPLYAASKCGHTNVVKLLLQHGADVSQCDEDGRSPLCKAIEGGEMNIVTLLLQHGVNVSQCDLGQRSPLYIASERGHTGFVSLLLQYEANVSQCEQDGTSPLHIASEKGHTKIVKLLLQHRADVSQCNKAGRSPLYTASGHGHTGIADLLLLHGADISLCEATKQTPLYTASEGGHDETVALLLKRGADVACCDSYGRSPLFAAIKCDHLNVVKVLQRHGADVSQSDNEGRSPLFKAGERGHTDIVTYLLQNGADVSQCDKDGRSPLYTASERGHTGIAYLLLLHGADVACCDHCGRSPLFAASKYGHINVVKVLQQHGADVSQCDNDGLSPLSTAGKHGHKDIVAYLLQHGADSPAKCSS